MQTIIPFSFATVVCDGCACRVDSNISVERDARLRDEGELLEYLMEERGWTEVDAAHDKYLCGACSKNPGNRKHQCEGRIIREEDELYGVCCDLCGRGFIDDDDSGGSHFLDQGDAIDIARGSYGWATIGQGTDNEKDYCPDCWHRCRELEEDLEGDCETCPNWEWCRGEGDLPNERPHIRYETCYIDGKPCKFYKGPRENAECTLPKGEKCLRLLHVIEEQKKREHK